MHKKCGSRCIIAGIFCTILMTGCTSIPASSPAREISKEIVNTEMKNALQCSEYLYGEGGIAHSVCSAEFIIVWDEEGECDVAK